MWRARHREFCRGGYRSQGGSSRQSLARLSKPTYPWMFDIENGPRELWEHRRRQHLVGAAVAKRVRHLKPGAEGPAESDPTPTETCRR